jgi:hypothetical protein
VLPIDAGKIPETLRSHTLRIGRQLSDAVADQPIAVSLDATFIGSRKDGARHLEVRVGNVETSGGGRQVFGAAAKADTEITALIRRNLQSVGRAAQTAVTAFTDGCSDLRSILADVGVTKAPILVWFPIAMRMQHTAQAAISNGQSRAGAGEGGDRRKRLRWRIWNGKAKNAQRSIVRIRKVMHVFKGERGHRTTGVPSGKLWSALHDVDRYLSGQSASLVNYAERYRADLRVGTAITEGTANFLVNRRINKSQQMRWSRRGADLLLQVRCAVYNGTLGSGICHRFEACANPKPVFAMASMIFPISRRSHPEHS